MMGAYSQTVAQPVAGKTATGVYAYPWATAIVFKLDIHNSNQHIWNVGEGSGNKDDNIYLRVDADGSCTSAGDGQVLLNECYIGSTVLAATGGWWGVYIATTVLVSVLVTQLQLT